MIDLLFARSQLAIEEACRQRDERRELQRQLDHERLELRRSIFETAMATSESRALREDR